METGPMDISDAQRDVRTVFLAGCGSVGVQRDVVSVRRSCRPAIAQDCDGRSGVWRAVHLSLDPTWLRSMGRPSALPKGHPMNALGMQVAFLVPLSLPLIGAATLYRQNWFYPAFMVVVGAHYLPFIFSYRRWQFGVLAASLISVLRRFLRWLGRGRNSVQLRCLFWLVACCIAWSHGSASLPPHR
jgi:hypothetical protein